MPKKTTKKARDVNQIAAAIIGSLDEEPERKPEKNPAAVALGSLGGKKGGPARAKKLSAKKRSEIAKKAAEARWGSSKKTKLPIKGRIPAGD